MSKRTGNESSDYRYSIGRLLDPKDEGIVLNELEWDAALAETRAVWKPDPARLHEATPPDIPSGRVIRRIRGFGTNSVPAHPECGLLLIYLLDPKKADIGFPTETPAVVAFGISFPDSNSGQKVEYKVTNLLWEQEYGAAD